VGARGRGGSLLPALAQRKRFSTVFGFGENAGTTGPGGVWSLAAVLCRTMATIRIGLFAAITLLLAPLAACSPDETAEAEIRAALTQWMADFNDGTADKVCELFAPDLRSNYRGQPERNFDELCALLQKSLKDEARSFTYALDIKEIIVAGDMAAVRLVWTLTIRSEGGAGTAIVSREPGLDIFRKQPDGSWKVARFLAFEED